jgi:hypothetical protein
VQWVWSLEFTQVRQDRAKDLKAKISRLIYDTTCPSKLSNPIGKPTATNTLKDAELRSLISSLSNFCLILFFILYPYQVIQLL